MTSSGPDVVELPDDLRQKSSDIWIRKMMTYFRMYDLDHDWVIHTKDIIAHMTEAAEGVVETEKVRNVVRPMREAIWKFIWEPAAIEREGELVVTLQSFLESRIDLAFQDTEEDKKNLIFILDSYFKICDENGDGVITKEEYFHVLAMYSVPKYGITVSFASMDKNGDGQISWTEMRDAFVDFYYSKLYGSDLLFWGPIVGTRVRYLKDEPPLEIPEEIITKSSDIWVRKMLTYFRLYDRRRVWAVRESDVIGRMTSKASKSFSKERLERFMGMRKKVWESVWLPSAQTINGEKVVTVQNWIRNTLETIQAIISGRVSANVSNLADVFFDLLDIDHDSQISKEEFFALYSLYGLNKYAMTVAFNAFDTDTNGGISKDELREGIVKFFVSFKYDEGVLAWGPIYPIKIVPVPDPPFTVPRSILQGTSEMWVRRLGTYFRLYDPNHRGYTTANDIVSVMRRRAAHFLTGLPEEKLQLLSQLRQTVWDVIWSDVAVEEKENKVVTWDRFIQSMFTKATGPDSDAHRKKFQNILDLTFKLADTDDNNLLDQQEHCKLLSIYGINRYNALIAFRATDVDCDGWISSSECIRVGMEFFFARGWGSVGDLFIGSVSSAKLLVVDDKQ